MKLYLLAITLLLSVPAVHCMEEKQLTEQKELTVSQMRAKLTNMLENYRLEVEDAMNSLDEGWPVLPYSIGDEYEACKVKKRNDPNWYLIPAEDFVGRFDDKEVVAKYLLYKKEQAEKK